MTERPAFRRRRAGRVGGILYALDLVVMFLRVAIVTTIWIGLFLGTFFGYLTAPFVVLVVFVIAYAVVDGYRTRARREAERSRPADEPFPDPIFSDPRSGEPLARAQVLDLGAAAPRSARPGDESTRR